MKRAIINILYETGHFPNSERAKVRGNAGIAAHRKFKSFRGPVGVFTLYRAAETRGHINTSLENKL